jgi:cytochrome c oxidase subunit 2
MRHTKGFVWAASLAAAIIGTAGTAFGAAPEPWQTGFQPAASLTMERVVEFHNLLLVIITVISAFVLLLLVYVMVRFNERRNPTPTKITHNTVLEVAWTAVPVIILIMIAIPSFRLLYFADRTAEPELTIKAIGHQWYWTYEYPDNGNFAFDAIMVPDNEIKPGQLRLLETDNRLVVPVGANIRLLVTADDVIHAWAIPAFGVKIDAVPGRVNETWFHVTKEGTYFGQCSELCGVGHAFMPIAVDAVSKENFAAWAAEARAKNAAGGDQAAPLAVAATAD